MGLMESGLYLTEEWVIHFVNPPYPCNFMGLSPRQKKKGFFPKCFINSQQTIPLPTKKKKKTIAERYPRKKEQFDVV
jgi:hypothetical protein